MDEDRATRRRSPVAAAAGVGGLWGLAGYGILWEGVPVTVSRPFVESVVGTIVLLPSRLVLWGILLAERVAGGPFELSGDHGWIAPVAGAVGAALAAVGAAAVRRARRPRHSPL
ncbi:MAG: hypothetical protein ACKO8G_07550 [Actinomycetota bacterium]